MNMATVICHIPSDSRNHEGGPLGNPNHAVALALEAAGDDTVIKNHRLRKIKLFHCLLNYIKVSSRTYRMLMRHFSNDGPAAYQAVLIIGNLRVPARIVRAREDSWNQMEYDTTTDCMQWDVCATTFCQNVTVHQNCHPERYLHNTLAPISTETVILCMFQDSMADSPQLIMLSSMSIASITNRLTHLELLLKMILLLLPINQPVNGHVNTLRSVTMNAQLHVLNPQTMNAQMRMNRRRAYIGLFRH